MSTTSPLESSTLGRDRVREHSSPRVNDRIDQLTRARVDQLAGAGPVAIGQRFGELDHEWDVDRALMATFAVLGGTTFALGIRRSGPLNRRSGWLYFFGAQMAFLFLHATVGWCPPVAVLRRLGVRTAKEIAAERRALEAKASRH